MALALRGSAAVPSGAPTTSFTVTVDAAVVTNDLLFLTVTSRDSTGAGSLAVTDNDTGGNAWVKFANSTDHKATVWWKRATSGTAGKTVTVSNAVGSASGVLKAFSDGNLGSTPYADVVVETNASGNESHASFTPSRANSMVCAAVFNYAAANAVTSLNWATLGASTATEKTSTGGNDCGNVFGHRVQSGGPSSTGTLTWSQTNGTTYSITWSIKPNHVGSGSPAAVGATASGAATALSSHGGSGDLTGVGAAVAGTAQHNKAHAGSGDLAAGGASLSGGAAVQKSHPASGAFAGAGATLSGEARRFKEHGGSGLLLGSGAAVTGAGRSNTAHTGSGVLEGRGGYLVGGAKQPAIHVGTGALKAAGAATDLNGRTGTITF